MLKCKDVNFCLDSAVLGNCMYFSVGQDLFTNTSFCSCQNSFCVWGEGGGRKSCLSWSSWQNSSGASPPPGPLLILQHLVPPTQAGTPLLLRGERETLALASFLNTFQSGWVGEKSFSNTLFNLQQNIFKAKQMNLMIPTHNVLSFLGDGSKWRSQALSPACGLDMWQEKLRDCPTLISPG